MKKILPIIGVIILVMVNSCEDGDNNKQDNNNVSTIKPVLESISPTSAVSHLQEFVLTATGKNFVPGSEIFFGSHEIETTYVSSTSIYGTVKTEQSIAPDLTKSEPQVVKVGVRNPEESGVGMITSNLLDFTLKSIPTFDTPRIIASTSGLGPSDAGIDSNGVLYFISSDNKIGTFLIKSFDGGTTWSEKKQCPFGGSGYKMKISENNTIYLTWELGKAFFSRSIDGGDSWTSPISTGIDACGHIGLALGKSNQLLISVKGDCGGTDTGIIFVSYSSDNGDSWSKPKNLGITVKTRLTSDGNGVFYIFYLKDKEIYQDTVIYLIKSFTGGGDWTNETMVIKGALCNISSDVFNKLNVFYESGLKLYHQQSADGGTTWSSPNLLYNGINRTDVGIETDRYGNISVIFGADEVEDANWNCKTMNYSRSSDDGKTWTNKVVLIDSAGFYGCLIILIDKNGTHYLFWVKWESSEERARGDIYFCRSTD